MQSPIGGRTHIHIFLSFGLITKNRTDDEQTTVWEIKLALKKSDEMTPPNGFTDTGSSPSYLSSTQKWWWWANSLFWCVQLRSRSIHRRSLPWWKFSTSKGSGCCDPLCRHIHTPSTTTHPRWTFKAKSSDTTWHDPSKKNSKTIHTQIHSSTQAGILGWPTCLKLTGPSLCFRISLTIQHSKLSNLIQCPNTEATLVATFPKSWASGDELLGTTTPLWASHTKLTPNPWKVCASCILIIKHCLLA